MRVCVCVHVYSCLQFVLCIVNCALRKFIFSLCLVAHLKEVMMSYQFTWRLVVMKN